MRAVANSLFAILFYAFVLLNPTQAAPPPTPENLQPAWLFGEVMLTWNDTAGAAGYYVYRYDATNTSWFQIAANVTVPRFREAGIAEPQNYVVTAVNADGESAPAGPVLAQESGPWFTVTLNIYDWVISETVAVFPNIAVSLLVGADLMLEVGAEMTNLTHFAWDTNYTTSHSLTISNLTPGTHYYARLTSVASNRTGITGWFDFTTMPPNQPPIAQSETYYVSEDPYYPLNFRLNASDPDIIYPPVALTFTVVDGPANGTLVRLDDSGWYSYTPNTNFFGTDTITFVASDGELSSDPGTITINVMPVDDAPEPIGGSVEALEDTPLIIELQANDVEGDPITSLQIVQWPTNGSLSWGEGPLIQYTPAPNVTSDDAFTFNVCDYGACSWRSATVYVNIVPVNDVPVAEAQWITAVEDTPTLLTLTGSDVDEDALTSSIADQPAHGSIQLQDGNWVYLPDANYNGLDSFTFTVTDGFTSSAPATVTIDVSPANDAPIVGAQPLTVAEDSFGIIPVILLDVDGDSLSPIIVTAAAHGAVGNWDGQSFTYLPDANYNGPDGFTFQFNDGTTTSAPVTVSITVTPLNDAPVGQPQGVETDEDTPVTFVPNASDVDGDTVDFIIETTPFYGTVTVENGQLTYAPNLNFTGEDSLAYRPIDGSATGEVAYVVFNVRPVNDPPVAGAQAVTAAEDSPIAITLGGSDVEGSALSFNVVTGPANGTLSGAAPNLIYTPNADYNGPDSFVFIANDGALDSAPATVVLSVTGVNDAPTANAQSVSTPYNTPVNITLDGTDVEGSVLNYIVLTSPANGVLSGTAPNLTFAPDIGWSGTTSFTFKVNDGSLDSPEATITIIVAPATSTPNAPSGLSATAVSQNQINLAWTDNSADEDGFKIERSNNGNIWTQIATVGPNIRDYSSTGLSANKTYYYRVRAHNVLGNSAYSNTASARTPR